MEIAFNQTRRSLINVPISGTNSCTQFSRLACVYIYILIYLRSVDDVEARCKSIIDYSSIVPATTRVYIQSCITIPLSLNGLVVSEMKDPMKEVLTYIIWGRSLKRTPLTLTSYN